jgi:hypothetical protein
MRETLRQVHEKTGVTIYGFFDDINVVGKPRQVMDALSELQAVLPSRSLNLNTEKSHFAYFHDELTPLSEKVRTSLANQNIEYHHDWVGVVGGVIGRDEGAIRRGIRHILANSGGHDVFFDRLQQPEISRTTAMVLLRMCMVPSMNYLLRCTAPVCIEDEADHFDQLMLDAAMDKLGIVQRERGESVVALLRGKLKNGGWGLTSAKATSPAAFLGSLAACSNEAAFAPLHSSPIRATSLLHGWITDSVQRVRQAAADTCDDILPPTADTFFSYYTCTNPSAADSLQSALHAKATSHQHEAAMKQLKQQSREGNKLPLAHMKAITTQAAWAWKMALPLGPRLRLSDTEYAIAARLNLGLPPFPDMETLPEHCPLCVHRMTKEPISLRDDPWHYLSCAAMTTGEGNIRHNEIADVLQHTALLLGAQARREVKGLAEKSKVRPDLQIFFPGRMLLTDVVVSHPMTASRVERHQSSTTTAQHNKQTKYSTMAARLGAELLPFSVATYGGLADDAMKLVQAMGEEGEETMGAWTKEEIVRYTLSMTAVAIQRGNTRVMLAGRMQSLKASK